MLLNGICHIKCTESFFLLLDFTRLLLEKVDEPRCLLLWKVVVSVIHSQWFKNALGEKFFQRHSRPNLNKISKQVGVCSVHPFLTRLKKQRQSSKACHRIGKRLIFDAQSSRDFALRVYGVRFRCTYRGIADT